jgi:D-aspartate ligase
MSARRSAAAPNRATALVLSFDPDPRRTAWGLDPSALALTRSLGRSGIPVVRIHPSRLEGSLLSRYCAAVETCPHPRSEEALVVFLLGLERRGAPEVLFPTGDDSAAFLARHQDVLRARYRLPVARPEVMSDLVDKQRQYARAQALGLPVPETYFPASAAEVRTLAARLESYPYVIKPLVSHRWRAPSVRDALGTGKGVRADAPHDLVAAYESVCRVDRRVMIQEVIGGSDDRLFTFLSYLDEQSAPLGYCIRKKIRQFPVDFGNCVLTESCFDPIVRDQSIRLLQGIGYHGLSGVEWKLDPRSGRYLLIEVNPRAVYTTAIAPACGVDLPVIAFRDLIGERVLPTDRFREGIKWIWLTSDLRAAFELHRRGELDLRSWWRSIRGEKVHAVFAGDDWRPFAAFIFGDLQKGFARFVKRSDLARTRRLAARA